MRSSSAARAESSSLFLVAASASSLATLAWKSAQIALSLPHWSAAAQVLAGTDLILTVSSRSAEHLREQAELVFFQPPLPVPSVSFQQVWHSRRHLDPAHAWLRQQLMQCC